MKIGYLIFMISVVAGNVAAIVINWPDPIVVLIGTAAVIMICTTVVLEWAIITPTNHLIAEYERRINNDTQYIHSLEKRNIELIGLCLWLNPHKEYQGVGELLEMKNALEAEKEKEPEGSHKSDQKTDNTTDTK